MDYVILTDSSADLPWALYRELDIPFVPFNINVGGENRFDDESFTPAELYGTLRGGVVATTSQVTPEAFKDFFTPRLREGKDIFYAGLASGLSATYESACAARDELAPLYPASRIEVVDSASVTLGLGILLHRLARLRDAGAPFEALREYVERNKNNINHLFTVNDLMFLQRGGRVSKTSAVVGSLLGIKPMLHVTPEGKLKNHGKVRGRRQSLVALAEEASACAVGTELEYVMLAHGDCEEDMLVTLEEMKKRFTINHIVTRNLGATIGAHSGPGTVALFFEGKPRME
ncbi:MAG: DegV family protein [Oscillospiraceae bacterium]|jgi:DegV family protein with EDD domain|nr:DegV family protein [Oscillospiraceae bacterium]